MSPRRTRRPKAVSRVTLVVQARRAQQALADAVHHADDLLPAADTVRQGGPAAPTRGEGNAAPGNRRYPRGRVLGQTPVQGDAPR